MKNYTRPFRNLPTEIRLLIWKFIICKHVRIFGDRSLFSHGQGLESDDENEPSRDYELLLVNKQVYSEVLPLLQQREVHTGAVHGAGFDYTNDSRIGRAWRSPSFGILHNLLTNSRWDSCFFYHFLGLTRPRTPRSIIVDILFDHIKQTFCHLWTRRCFSLYIYYAITVFAGVAISKGLVTEVRVNTAPLSLSKLSSQLSLWEPEKLQLYLPGSSTAKAQSQMLDSDGHESHHVEFLDEMLALLGPIMTSGIKIATRSEYAGGTELQKRFRIFINYRLAD